VQLRVVAHVPNNLGETAGPLGHMLGEIKGRIYAFVRLMPDAGDLRRDTRSVDQGLTAQVHDPADRTWSTGTTPHGNVVGSWRQSVGHRVLLWFRTGRAAAINTPPVRRSYKIGPCGSQRSCQRIAGTGLAPARRALRSALGLSSSELPFGQAERVSAMSSEHRCPARLDGSDRFPGQPPGQRGWGDDGCVSGDLPSTGLGRHSTARAEPWHSRWLAIRPALRLVEQLTYVTERQDAESASKLEGKLAASDAFAPFVVSGLEKGARARLIAQVIRDAAAALRRGLVLPLDKTAEPEQAILYWYLALCEGHPASRIGRDLPSYVKEVETRDAEQWVASRMWATGRVPHARSGPGLSALTRRIDVGLAAVDLVGEPAQAALAVVGDAVRRLALENSAAVSWLAVFAHFAPDPIPLGPLQDEIPRGLPPVVGPIDRQPLSTYLDPLAAGGLLTMLNDDVSFLIPRAVARVTMECLDDETRKLSLRAAIVLLGMAFGDDCDEQHKWHLSERLLPHALSVANFAQSIPIGRADAATFLMRAARYYRARAQLDNAISTGRRAINLLEAAKGVDSPTLAWPLGDLAHALMNNDELAEAETVLSRVLHLEKIGAQSHLVRSSTLNLYGNVLKRMERLPEAAAALRSARKLFPSDDRPVSYYHITNDLGRTVEELGQEEEALELFHEALAGLKGAPGTNQVKKNFALTLYSLGRLGDARDVLEEVLADEIATPTPDQGFIRWIIRPLAAVYRELGDAERSRTLYARLGDLDQPWVT
jgi:tetratricopeptide (TPR) repeat protein